MLLLIQFEWVIIIIRFLQHLSLIDFIYNGKHFDIGISKYNIIATVNYDMIDEYGY